MTDAAGWRRLAVALLVLVALLGVVHAVAGATAVAGGRGDIRLFHFQTTEETPSGTSEASASVFAMRCRNPVCGALLLSHGLATTAAAAGGAWSLTEDSGDRLALLGGVLGLIAVPPIGIVLGVLALYARYRGRVEDRTSTTQGPATGAVDEPTRAESNPRTASDRFAVRDHLGTGGMGRTYLARDRVLEREVVIKELLPHLRQDPSRLESFLEEARTVAKLSHPNVVTLHDVVQDDGDVTLVMEYVEGGSLAEAIDDGPLEVDRAAAIADDLLAGLAAVHDAGIVHRDVKPSNVLLKGDGTAKLADFGVAYLPDGETAVTGRHPGTIRYMAPEQIQGGEIDERADVYAATAVLYEALTGETYLDFAGRDAFQVQKAIVEAQPRLPVGGLSEAVNDVLAKGLAKDPDDRYDSAEAMREGLRGLG